MADRPGVLGGGSLSVPDWTAFLSREYLADYVRSGGAAVKLAVVGDEDTGRRLARALGAAADAAGCVFVSASAAQVRLSQVDALFFAVARAVDWDALAAAVVRQAYDAVAFPADDDLTVTAVADRHEVDPRELYRSVRRQVEHRLLGDRAVPAELQRAVLRLAQARLGPADVAADERAAVLGWLRGDRVPLATLRPLLIGTRITRTNARPMLVGVGRLLLSAGWAGLVVHLDAGRLAESRRPPVELRDGLYYSKAAVLDAFEVLRQLIDATDELRGTLVVAAVPPDLLTDESRGLPAYAALHLRVADEVRDRRRPNPFAALVRLEVRLEAVPA